MDLPSAVRMRGGRVVIPARRPAALVLPFALFSEAAGVLLTIFWSTTIGIVWCAAPIAALLVTTVQRPTLELTSDGLVQRQYPFSSLTRWDLIAHVGLTHAGNRHVLAYKLVEGVPPPRRQPAAALLRAAGRDYDGGYFADSLRGDPEQILATVRAFLDDPRLRERLPAARR